MKKMLLLIATVGLVFSHVACKKAAVEGNYKLDKAAMKAEAEARIAKMDPKKQGFAKFGLAMIDMMNISLSLEAGGKAAMNTEMPNPFKKGEIRKRAEMGTWKMDGGKVVITTTRENPKTKTKKETTVTCDLNGNKLTCSREGRKRKQTMVFIKG